MSFAAAYAVRDLHVSATPRDCIRHVLQKLDSDKKRARAFRAVRHGFLKQALIAHAQNRSLYTQWRF